MRVKIEGFFLVYWKLIHPLLSQFWAHARII